MTALLDILLRRIEAGLRCARTVVLLLALGAGIASAPALGDSLGREGAQTAELEQLLESAPEPLAHRVRGHWEDASPAQRERMLTRLRMAAERGGRPGSGPPGMGRGRAAEERWRLRQDLRDATPEERAVRREHTREHTRGHMREHTREVWRELRPEERDRRRGQLERFRHLPETQRRHMRNRLDRFMGYDEHERSRIRDNARRFHEMSDDERREVRQQWERFQRLSPEERDALLEQLDESED